jgi:hypothetical protein
MSTDIEIERDLERLHLQNTLWCIYTVRICFVLFIVSCGIEMFRIAADDRADYFHAVNNPPEGCIPSNMVLETTWSWSSLHKPISVPLTWLYTSFFVPPITNDCSEFYRRTNPMLLYLPKIPQATANVATSFFLTPFIMFLDKFGDALRHFMDKFNVAERIFGVVLLISTMLLSTLAFGFVIWFQFKPRYIIDTHTAPLTLTPTTPLTLTHSPLKKKC